jgi:hypothetical protein
MVFGTSAIETYMKIGFYMPSGNYIVTAHLSMSMHALLPLGPRCAPTNHLRPARTSGQPLRLHIIKFNLSRALLVLCGVMRME